MFQCVQREMCEGEFRYKQHFTLSVAAECEARGFGLAEEMFPTLAVCEQASVAGSEVGRLLFVFRVSMVAVSGCVLVDTLTNDTLELVQLL